MFLNQGEHGGELREEQDPSTFGEEGIQKLEEIIELCGSFRLLCLLGLEFKKSGVAADLAKLEEGVEDGEL